MRVSRAALHHYRHTGGFENFGGAVAGVEAFLDVQIDARLTIGIMLSSIAFALTAAASLYVVYRERHAAMNHMAYWHSVLVAAAVAVVAAYMGYWGLIGLRLWAC